MSQRLVRRLSNATITSPSKRVPALTRSASLHSKGKAKSPKAEMAEARQWLKNLDPETVPDRISEISFSKSIGGFDTNSSKARLQTPLEKLLPLLPTFLHEKLHTLPYYVESSDSLVFTSAQARKQKDNRDDCYRKLFATLQEVGKDSIPSEKDVTSGRGLVPQNHDRLMGSSKFVQYKQKLRAEKESLQQHHLFERNRLRKLEERNEKKKPGS